MNFEYSIVDVFTSAPLEGNPLAVFHDARALDRATMQRIARETNLSETTFLLPPSADGAAADVRIFTPYREMVFAGHPTIGTAFVMRRLGIVDGATTAFALHEGVGLVPVRVDDEGMIWLRTPAIGFGATHDTATLARILGVDPADVLPSATPQIVTAGNPHVYVALRDTAAVDRAGVDTAAYRAAFGEGIDTPALFVFAPVERGAYSRMFAPEIGVVEDPATGSATGPLAAYMMRYGLAPSGDGTRFVSEQGTKMGRRSLLHVLVHGEHGADGIEVGGHTVQLATAVMSLEI